jgi:hypothetical protein
MAQGGQTTQDMGRVRAVPISATLQSSNTLIAADPELRYEIVALSLQNTGTLELTAQIQSGAGGVIIEDVHLHEVNEAVGWFILPPGAGMIWGTTVAGEALVLDLSVAPVAGKVSGVIVVRPIRTKL